MKHQLLRISVLALASLSALNATAQEWSGAYVGGHIGMSKVDDGGESLLFDTNKDGSYGDTVRTLAGANAFSPGFCDGAPKGNNAGAGCESDDEKDTYGLRVGYDWQVNNLVFGVVGEFEKNSVADSATGFSTTPAAYHLKREIDSLAAIRGRLGYAANTWLVYATAGLARGDLDRSFMTTNTANSFTPIGGDKADGHQLGLGVEKKIPGNWALGIEYLQTALDDDGYVVQVGPGTAAPTNPFLLVNSSGTNLIRSDDRFKNQAIRLTLSYRFAAS